MSIVGPAHHKPIDSIEADNKAFAAYRKQPDVRLGLMTSLNVLWQHLRKEHAVFFITCLYLIFEYNRPHLVYPGIDIIPWGKTLIVLAVILCFFDRTSKSPFVTAMLPLGGFCICVLLSMCLAFSPVKAANEWIDFFGWVFVILLLTSVVNSRSRLFLFIGVYFLVNLKMAQYGFRSWAMRGFGYSSWGVTGSPGWFQNSGEFGMEMAVFLPLVLAYIATFRHYWSRSVRLFFYSLATMVMGSIIASSSRGGMLGLVMVAVWCLAYSRKRIKTLLLISFAATVIYAVMPSEFKARFEAVGEDRTSLSRLLYWEYSMEAIRKNLWTGIGFRNWTTWVAAEHPELIGVIGSRDRLEVIHNTYLEATSELGLCGAMSYAIILIQIFFTNRRSTKIAQKKCDHFIAATAVGLNGSLFSYLVTSYFMSVLYYPYIWILLALTVSLSSICRDQISQSDSLM